MKDWIQEKYNIKHWDPEKFRSIAGQEKLHRIIQEA
jgi:hypothetical protein